MKYDVYHSETGQNKGGFEAMAVINVILVKRPDSNKYYARWIDPVSLRERRKSTKTNIKRDAERFALRLEKELNEGTYFEQTNTDWSDFRQRYETEVVTALAERTAGKIGTVFNHVERIANPKQVINLDANAISKIVKQLRNEGQEEITIKNNMGHLKAALNWAEEMSLISRAPKVPKFKRARAEKAMRGRPLCLEEFERMLDAVPKVIRIKGESKACKQRRAEVIDSWKFYLHGLWYSGLRLSESLDLYWDREDKLSLDFSRKHPMMRIRAESEKGNKDRLLPIVPEFARFLESVPEDERTGPVFDPLAERKHLDRMTSTAISKKVAEIGELANVVVGDKGNIDKETGERKPRYASAHDLRRSFGERWSQKVMPQALMQLMRHESMETTLKYYVGRNADKVADAIWSTEADPLYNSLNSTENQDISGKGDNSQVVTTKEVRK